MVEGNVKTIGLTSYVLDVYKDLKKDINLDWLYNYIKRFDDSIPGSVSTIPAKCMAEKIEKELYDGITEGYYDPLSEKAYSIYRRILKENPTVNYKDVLDSLRLWKGDIYGMDEETLAIEVLSDIRNRCPEPESHVNESFNTYTEKIKNDFHNIMNTLDDSGTPKKNTEEYEHVNHPSHYNNYSREVIDMMADIWGVYNAALWCEMTAFKYRMRMGTKPGNPLEQDIDKERWYLDKAAELRKRLQENSTNSKA